jgi:hypothetical protein
MPKWLQTLLALIGLGAKEFVAVKTGTPVATALQDGVPTAAPLVGELAGEIAADINKAKAKPTPTK